MRELETEHFELQTPSKADYESGVRGHLSEVVRLGWGGAKSNLLPGAVLWVLGLALVIAYYQIEAVSEVLDRLGDFKLKYSPWFAIISTALFGSLIPWLVQAVFLKSGEKQPFRHVPWLLLFFNVPCMFLVLTKNFSCMMFS